MIYSLEISELSVQHETLMAQ